VEHSTTSLHEGTTLSITSVVWNTVQRVNRKVQHLL